MPELLEPLLLNPSDQRWLDLIASNPKANIFHHPAWVNTLAACYGYAPFVIAVCDAHNDICAAIPVMQLGGAWGGKRWIALPFTDHCQPLSRDDESLRRLVEGLAEMTRSRHLSHIDIRWELPTHPALRVSSPFVQHRLALEPDVQQVARGLHRTQRQNIGTAEKKGVRIRQGEGPEDMRTFYRLQCATRKRQGLPVQPRRFFDLVFENLIRKDLGFILLAYAQDECLAAGLFLHWQQTLTYKYSASADRGHELRPNHLLTWSAVQWGCEHGMRTLDFGRTDADDEGLRTFKNRWGAVETPLGYSTIHANPQAIRPMASSGRLARVMQVTLRHSPVWASRVAGELLYGRFGS